MKEEIKHFKSLLRQGSLRHMNILLDDNFQKELLTIIKNYEKLQNENQQLKKQLEEINKMIEKCGFVNIEQVMLSYCWLIAQQKEFINYLEDEIHSCEAVSDLLFNSNKEMKVYKEILQKYRKIIGVER